MTSDPGLQFRAVDAFADLAEELALDGPLVIGADDLHWADPSSLVTLGALAARLNGLPAAIIGCFRPAPAVADLDRLASGLEAAGGRRLSLRGLDGRAVAELVADAVGAAPGRRLLAGIAGAAGNPLFVTELLGALAQEQMITIADGQAEVARPDPAADAAADDPAPDQLPGRGRAAGTPVRLRPGDRLHAHRPGGGHRPFGGGPVDGAGRAAPGPGARGRRAPAPVPPRPDPRRDLRGPARPACAARCTARPGSGWPRPERLPPRWPSTWPAGRAGGTPRPSGGWPGPPARPP